MASYTSSCGKTLSVSLDDKKLTEEIAKAYLDYTKAIAGMMKATKALEEAKAALPKGKIVVVDFSPSEFTSDKLDSCDEILKALNKKLKVAIPKKKGDSE
jgi:SepF-like predicted cell division protein (DUF552 family)